ncbi:MAG: hypothetical protein ACOH15_11470 [Acetobacterium sp.]
MELNKKELKKIDLAFRTSASRVLQIHPGDAERCLKMFVDFVDNTPLIIEYINSFTVDDIDIEKEVNEVADSYSRKAFYLGATPEEEIVRTYRLLKYLVEHDISLYTVTQPYGSFNDNQQRIKGFGERVILPFVSHIEAYIHNIRIDMGADEEVKHQIITNVTANHNSQVNLAQNNATINATQNNGIDQVELNKLIDKILATIPETLEPEERVIICDSVETIQEELNSDNPRNRLIRMAKNALDTVAPKIAGSIEFAASLVTLYQFIQPLL